MEKITTSQFECMTLSIKSHPQIVYGLLLSCCMEVVGSTAILKLMKVYIHQPTLIMRNIL